MTNETYDDERPMPVRYTVYSLELAPYCPDTPDDDEWSDELESKLRDFAGRYADALTKALRAEYPDRPVEVDVVHQTTGGLSYTEPEDVERVQEVANRVLDRLEVA